MKRARNHSIANAHHFPRNDYHGYWECMTDQLASGFWTWTARVYNSDTQQVVAEASSPTPLASDTAARDGSQKWALAQMAGMRRPAPFHPISAADAALLVQLFDAARLGTDYPAAALDVLWHCENPRDTPDHDAILMKWKGAAMLQRSQMKKAGTWKNPLNLCDRIRGLLASQGYQLGENESIANPAPTQLVKSPNGQSGRALGLGPLGFLWDLLRWCFEFFALGYSTTIRNLRVDDVSNAIDGGSGAGLWRIYDGTRPATGGTATTLLAQLTFTDPNAGAPASGVLTFSSITQDASADATGTATWGRWVDSAATFCADHAVGTSGSDLNLNTTSVTSGDTVSITSATLTGGNP